jgi:acetyl-CoA C-acetyltransferase
LRKVVITHAKRTPIGSFNGDLSSFSAPQLGSIVIKSLINESGIDKNQIDEVILGNVLTSGIGQAPARQAALFANLPEKTECLTINKMCGSGLKAVMLAAQAIQCGDAEIVIAGGQESMSNSPYILNKARQGYRLGHANLIDSMIHDGLWDVYNNIHMGNCAEVCAKEFNFTREMLDAFSINSYLKALKAQKEFKFSNEITPITITSKNQEKTINIDEEPGKVIFDKISSLKPAFEKDGLITAANASKLNDGAAALLMMSDLKAKELGLIPLVEIISQSSFAKKPLDFTTAPADAIIKVLNKSNISLKEIDLYEINEAFAVVSLAIEKILNLDNSRVNVNGGAIALGHPIGASGARILTTLVHEMKKQNSKYGIASLCIGGGEASAILVKNY